MAGSICALEPVGSPPGSTQVANPSRVHLVGGRGEDDVDSMLGRERRVAVEVARIRDELGGLGELRGVHEHARGEHVALRSCRREQRGVAVVKRAHRRDETDDPIPRQVELFDRPRDDHGRVASASAS